MRAELAMTNSIAWADRYRALSDMVAALRVLWTEDEACHHGEFYDFDPVWSHPKPQQQPGPPLLAAATGPKAIGECLSWADGWLPGDAAYRDLSAAVHDFRVRAEDAGRDPATLDLTVMAWGDPSANRLARYRDLGFTRVVVGGGRRDGDDPRRHCRSSTDMRRWSASFGDRHRTDAFVDQFEELTVGIADHTGESAARVGDHRSPAAVTASQAAARSATAMDRCVKPAPTIPRSGSSGAGWPEKVSNCSTTPPLRRYTASNPMGGASPSRPCAIWSGTVRRFTSVKPSAV